MRDRLETPEKIYENERVKFVLPCDSCHEDLPMIVLSTDFLDWKDGRNPKMAFPYLSSDHHMRLITSKCEECVANNR